MTNDDQKAFLRSMASLHLNADHSDMKIVCGRRESSLHRAIVCPQSKVLAKELKPGFKESSGIIEHEGPDEGTADTVDRMIQYLYTQDYNVPLHVRAEATSNNTDVNEEAGKIPGREQAELDDEASKPHDTQFSVPGPRTQASLPVNEVLMMHVRVHHIADYYNISQLKAKTGKKFSAIVNDEKYSWEKSGFANLLDEIYKLPKSQGAELRAAAVSLAQKHVQNLVADEEFMMAISEPGYLGEFCSALLDSVASHLRHETYISGGMIGDLRQQISFLGGEIKIAEQNGRLEKGRRQRAENDLERVKDIFQKIRKCKTYSCERTIDVSVERSGRAGQGEYMVRCLGCQAIHKPEACRYI